MRIPKFLHPLSAFSFGFSLSRLTLFLVLLAVLSAESSTAHAVLDPGTLDQTKAPLGKLCDPAEAQALKDSFKQASVEHHANPASLVLEARWREAAKAHLGYSMTCFDTLVPDANTGEHSKLHAMGTGGISSANEIHQDTGQIIDHGGMIMTADGPRVVEPGDSPAHHGEEELHGHEVRPDFVTDGRKWGPGTLFGGGTNVEGPGIPAGTVTYSFMADGVDLSAETAGLVNTAYTSLPTYSACFDTELTDAFDAWSAVANIDFVEVADNGLPFNAAGATGDIRIGAHPFAGPGGVLAHAFIPPPNGTSAAGDMHFDTAENWTCDNTGIDIGIVATHEIGHSIGLLHEATETAVMNAFYNAALTTLQPDDAEGAVTIYDPVIVVNEVDYDQPGTDAAEFVELKNISTHSIDLAGWELRFLNGATNAVYRTTALSGVVPSGEFFVICADPANLCNCDLDASPNTDYIQNGAPDAVAIFDPNGNFVDALSYEGTVGNTDYVEGTGNAATDSNTTAFIGYSRIPDGDDNNANSTDWEIACITPGSANVAGATGCADPCPVVPMVDIQLTKTESIDPVIAGSGTGNLTYVVTAQNNGPDNATGVVVNEMITMPAGVSLDSVTPSGSTSYAGTTWTIGNLANGASETLTLVFTVGASAAAGTDVIGDTATVTAVNETDTNPSNNTITVLTSIAREADIALSKTESLDPVSRGSGAGNLTYIVTATNNGPSDASNVLIAENLTLPAGVSVDSITPSAGSTGGASPNYTWTIPTLADGASATLTVVLTVAASAATGTDVICDTASLTSLNETDTVSTNDSVTECTTITDSLVDIKMSKTESIDPVVAGSNGGVSNLTYIVTAENLGPSTATNLVISEDLTLPTGVTVASITPSAGTVTGTSPNYTWTIASLAPNASATLTVVLSVPASQAEGTDIIGDTAAVVSLDQPLTNTGDDSVTELTSVITRADLSMSKTDSPDPVIAGENLTYNLSATNIGPSDAQDLRIQDTLPSGAAFVSATPSAGASCTMPAIGATGGTVDCTWSGATTPTTVRTVSVVVRTCPDLSCGDQLSNTASASTTTTDPVSTNDSATATSEVQTQSNLELSKVGEPDQALVGDNVTYTIVVTNTGPSNASSPVVTDQLPPNFTFLDARISGGTGSCSAVGTLVTCNLGTIGAPDQCATSFAEVVTIEIDAMVGSNEGTPLVAPGCIAGLVTNTASVATANCLADLGTLSDSAETCTAPQPPVIGSLEYSVIMPLETGAEALPLSLPGEGEALSNGLALDAPRVCA